MKAGFLALLLMVALAPVSATEILSGSLRLYPQSYVISDGTPFFVSLEAHFSDACGLGEGQIAAELDDQTLNLTFTPEVIADGECDGGSFRRFLSTVFGPFRVPSHFADNQVSGEILDVVFIHSDFGEIASFQTQIYDEPLSGASPLTAGTYWSPDLPGAAFAIERQSDQLFAVELTYDNEAGTSTWRTVQASLRAGAADSNLIAVSDGPCLECGDDASELYVDRTETPIQIIAAGSSRIFVHYGDEPSRAIVMDRFAQSEVSSTIDLAADESFTVPDLTGKWLFYQEEPNFTIVQRADLRPVDSDLLSTHSSEVQFTDEARGVVFSCLKDTSPDFFCSLSADGDPRGAFGSRDIAHDQMIDIGRSVLGVRLGDL